MTAELFIAAVAGVGALLGAIAGRAFAVEAPSRITAVFAAAYCGAGAGLVSAMLFPFLLVLVVNSWSSGFGAGTLAEAVEAIWRGAFWSVAGGAAGGFLIGILVAPFKRRKPSAQAPLRTGSQR
jgi:hypothetical protein